MLLSGKNGFAVKYYFENAKEIYFGFGKSGNSRRTKNERLTFRLRSAEGALG